MWLDPAFLMIVPGRKDSAVPAGCLKSPGKYGKVGAVEKGGVHWPPPRTPPQTMAKATNPPCNTRRTPASGMAPLLLRQVGCVILVLVFVNLYDLYRLLGELLGREFLAMAPLILPPLLLTLVLFTKKRADRDNPVNRPALGLGLLLCLFALTVPDGEIAVKRIHVAQYLLLSLVVRYSLASEARGSELTLTATLLTSLYGVHDELLQGLHPDRTYGLRDMLVNALAGSGGGLFWHGLQLFQRPGEQCPAPNTWSWRPYLAPLALLVAVAAMAGPLIAYRHHHLPAWPFLPLAALLVLWGLALPKGDPGRTRLLLPPGLLALLFLLYPLAVNALQIPFY